MTEPAQQKNIIEQTIDDGLAKIDGLKSLAGIVGFFVGDQSAADAIADGTFDQNDINRLLGIAQRFKPGLIEQAIADKTEEMLSSRDSIGQLVDQLSELDDETLGKIFEQLKSNLDIDIPITEALGEQGITIPAHLIEDGGELSILKEKSIQDLTPEDIETVKEEILTLGPADTISLIAGMPTDKVKSDLGSSFIDGIRDTMLDHKGKTDENGNKYLAEEEQEVLNEISEKASAIIKNLPEPITEEALTQAVDDMAELLEEYDTKIAGWGADAWIVGKGVADHRATIIDGMRNSVAGKVDSMMEIAGQLKDMTVEDFRAMLNDTPPGSRDRIIDMIEADKDKITSFMNDPDNIQIIMAMMEDSPELQAEILETARNEINNHPLLGPILEFFGRIMEFITGAAQSLGFGQEPTPDPAAPGTP